MTLDIKYSVPGVYKQEVFPAPPVELRTGVPAFLGLADVTPPAGSSTSVVLLTRWEHFQGFVKPKPDSFLPEAVLGFFQNGGDYCYVVGLADETKEALLAGLAAIEEIETIDLVCAPDIVAPRTAQISGPTVRELQQVVLDYCDSLGDRFAILDSEPSTAPLSDELLKEVTSQRNALNGGNGALYFPWLGVPLPQPPTSPSESRLKLVPPCGHLAGTYARSDEQTGVWKAPANMPLEGVIELQYELDDVQQAKLNTDTRPGGVNVLRTFVGRGFRAWGAKTLSRDTAWQDVSVRRLFLTVWRWIRLNLNDVAFEPNTPRVWVQVTRELNAYLADLLRQGALLGETADEAFYVKCDGETNPPEVRDAGRLVTEIGLAPALPNEFVVARIVQNGGSLTVSTISGP